ncbi:AraC family transcriptional regulator [Roseibium sp.]|uniref:AraC family transcriptional regulator n=1 Tax=Roseibium sp. TaxID=1936156 RepID=UPI003A9779CF
MHFPRPDRARYVLGDISAHISFLNCERISDRRHIHHWAVEPHFHEGLSQLFVFAGGRIDARIDSDHRFIEGPALVWLPALITHGFAYPQDMVGWVLTVPTRDVSRLAATSQWMASWIDRPQILQGAAHQPVIDKALALIRTIEAEHDLNDEAQSAVLEAQFLLMLAQLHRGLQQVAGERTPPGEPRSQLLRAFLTKLDQRFLQVRSVSEYAGILSVTPTHLSRVAKAMTGRTAAELIQERVLLEAKRKLALTDMPISEIAYELSFSSASYFTRFFRAREKVTPKAFRLKSRR